MVFKKNLSVAFIMRTRFILLFVVLSLMPFCVNAKRVYIKQNIAFSEQLLSYEKPVVYVISSNIDLKGSSVSIPDKSTLLFVKEGVIDNGEVVFNNVTIKNKTKHSVFRDCSFSGKLINKKLNISSFGVKADGISDDSPIINDVLTLIEGVGCELLFDCDGDYGISSPNRRNAVFIGSNTSITFTGKGFLKLLCTSNGGSVLSLKEKAHDVVINNIQIDGGGESVIVGNSGQNGIGACNFNNFHVNGGIIRNCHKGQDVIYNGEELLGDGGKGIQIESFNCKNAVFNNIRIENCHAAISCHRNLSLKGEIDVVFSNIYGDNCEQFAIIHQTNGEDFTGKEQRVFIGNFVAHNCGNPDGVFIFSRTRYLKIEKGLIEGNYETPAIFRGRIARSIIRDVTIKQPCKAIVDLNPSPYGQDIKLSDHNYFDLNIYGSYEYIVKTDSDKKYPYRSLTRSLICVKANSNPRVAVYSNEVDSSGKLNIKLLLPNNTLFEGTSALFNNTFSADYKNIINKQIVDIKTCGKCKNRPKDLKKEEEGFTFWNTESSVLEIWNGSKWVCID